MGFMAGKRALIVGVASDRSIATGIAEAFAREGKPLSLSQLVDPRGGAKPPRPESLCEGNTLHGPRSDPSVIRGYVGKSPTAITGEL